MWSICGLLLASLRRHLPWAFDFSISRFLDFAIWSPAGLPSVPSPLGLRFLDFSISRSGGPHREIEKSRRVFDIETVTSLAIYPLNTLFTLGSLGPSRGRYVIYVEYVIYVGEAGTLFTLNTLFTLGSLSPAATYRRGASTYVAGTLTPPVRHVEYVVYVIYVEGRFNVE